jgi:hypothetical protein
MDVARSSSGGRPPTDELRPGASRVATRRPAAALGHGGVTCARRVARPPSGCRGRRRSPGGSPLAMEEQRPPPTRPSQRSSSGGLRLDVDYCCALDMWPRCSNDCAVAGEERNCSPGAPATPDRAASSTDDIEHRRLRASFTAPRAPSSSEHCHGTLEAELHQGQSLCASVRSTREWAHNSGSGLRGERGEEPATGSARGRGGSPGLPELIRADEHGRKRRRFAGATKKEE